jgi:type IV fimbrial biogenesis protein FimT
MKPLDRSRRPRLGRAQGFTVVEMMAVIAVVVVVIALVAPSFRDLVERQRLRGMATEMAADLNFARSEAVRRNRNVFFKVESTASFTCYAIFVQGIDANCTCRRTSSTCLGDAEEIRTQRFNRSIGATVVPVTTTREVRFNAGLGLPAVTDFSASISGSAAALRVSVGPTGRVQICSADARVRDFPECQ